MTTETLHIVLKVTGLSSPIQMVTEPFGHFEMAIEAYFYISIEPSFISVTLLKMYYFFKKNRPATPRWIRVCPRRLDVLTWVGILGMTNHVSIWEVVAAL